MINRYPEPEARRTGRRRPHVPSSKPTMSKNHQLPPPRKNPEATNSGGQPSSPILLPGDWVSVYRGDRAKEPLKQRPRPVKRHIWRPLATVNGFFHISFTFPVFRQIPTPSPPIPHQNHPRIIPIPDSPDPARVTLSLLPLTMPRPIRARTKTADFLDFQDNGHPNNQRRHEHLQR